MAATGKRRRGVETPVQMFWQFSDDGGIVPRLTIESDSALETVFNEYGVESVAELEDAVVSNPHSVDQLRLGVVAGKGDETTFHTDAELLATVEGISESLADGLVEWCHDIPTLCKEYRRQGPVYVGDLLHDAEVSGREWVGELEALVDELSERDNLEQRLKDAGVWVEPDNVSAEY